LYFFFISLILPPLHIPLFLSISLFFLSSSLYSFYKFLRHSVLVFYARQYRRRAPQKLAPLNATSCVITLPCN
jgi:hypothetical protein